jgi:N-acetylglucosaminyldiphosphoundecaprenol N-acetyl-beta-D-mannosaminyltransferase
VTPRAAHALGASRAPLLGLTSSCYVGNLRTAVETIVERAAAGQGGYVCCCNVHVLITALHEPRLRRVLAEAEVRLPDGEPVAWLQRRLGFSHARRIGGPDLFPRVVARGRDVGLRHFFVGSSEPELERLRNVMVSRYPGAEILGLHAPPHAVEPKVEEAALRRMRETGAQVAWVGLGAPKQEIWMAHAAQALPAVTFVGVGAAFDFLRGDKRRAPLWMQRAGLEWLFRLGVEPRRLASRYLRTNSEFLGRAAMELARRRA